MEDMFSVASMRIETPGKIDLDFCPVTIKVELYSNLPKPVKSSQLQVAILLCDGDHEKHSEGVLVNGVTAKGRGNSSSGGSLKGVVKRSSFENKAGNKDKLSRKESLNMNPVTCEEEDVNVALMDANYSVLRLDLSQHLDVKQDKVVHGGRLLCHNSHQALRYFHAFSSINYRFLPFL